MKDRLTFLYFFILILFSLVLVKFAYYQLLNSRRYQKESLSQSYKLDKIYQKQGSIYFSDNFPLSLYQQNYHLSLYKPNLKQSLSDVVAQIGQVNPQFLANNQALITNFDSNQNQKWLTFPTPFFYDDLELLSKIPGVSFETTQSRIYPEASLSAKLAHNLERKYQKIITGQPGFRYLSKDATGKIVLAKKGWSKPSVNGRDLFTSINRSIQYIIETKLTKGLQLYQADSGMVAVIQPQTGQILGLAAYEASPSADSTKVINVSNTFEPGSIFKPLVVAIGLDSQKINSNFICPDCHQPRVIGQYTISNWDHAVHPDSDLKEIIKNSDNIGMSAIIDQIGETTFLKYFHLLELDQKSNLELLGENIAPTKTLWPEIDLATASFGQGIAVNQIQMLKAFNVLANDGTLVTPSLLKNSPLKSKKVFDVSHIKTIKDILKYATENGAVSQFKPKNVEVCAKSGTAQIAIKGGYTDSSTIGSYVGFSPCKDPKFTMIVTINNPKTSPWGSSTAAPIWFEIAQNILPLL